jgi:hypothetical protein
LLILISKNSHFRNPHGTNFYKGKNELNLPPIKENMKHILCILFAIQSLAHFGQGLEGQAIIFSESGEKFRVFLNGELMNEDPRANVVLTGLTHEFYQAQIDFKDASLGDFTSENFVIKLGMEVTYRIKWTKKGYVMRFFSERALNEFPASEYQQEMEHSSAPPAMAEPQPNIPNQAIPTKKVTTTTTTTSTTTTQNPAPSQNVHMNINMNDQHVGVNIQSSGNSSSVAQTTTTTTTTTHTNIGHHNPNTSNPNSTAPIIGHQNCYMEVAAFNQAKESIAKKSFSDSKMTLAKQITASHCFSALQIKEITALFDFETDRLDYATFAYVHCTDKQNYYIVNDAFQFESTIDELNKNITKKK